MALSALPSDVLLYVFSFLDYRAVSRLAQCCKAMDKETQRWWRQQTLAASGSFASHIEDSSRNLRWQHIFIEAPWCCWVKATGLEGMVEFAEGGRAVKCLREARTPLRGVLVPLSVRVLPGQCVRVVVQRTFCYEREIPEELVFQLGVRRFPLAAYETPNSIPRWSGKPNPPIDDGWPVRRVITMDIDTQLGSLEYRCDCGAFGTLRAGTYQIPKAHEMEVWVSLLPTEEARLLHMYALPRA